MKEFMIPMALEEIPVSGCTCIKNKEDSTSNE
jgi:hypothetical protein